MGSHPANLILRFFLELAALAGMGMWGWTLGPDWAHLLLAMGVPIGAMAIWATFAVPNDPSRSGKAPIPTPGTMRLVIEGLFFGFGAWSMFAVGHQIIALVFGVVVIVHYLVSYDRIAWLLKQ